MWDFILYKIWIKSLAGNYNGIYRSTIKKKKETIDIQ